MKIEIEIDDSVDGLIFTGLLSAAKSGLDQRFDQLLSRAYSKVEVIEEAILAVTDEENRDILLKLRQQRLAEVRKIHDTRMAAYLALRQLDTLTLQELGRIPQ